MNLRPILPWVFPMLGCAGFPTGIGNRMDVCGTVVDGELRPIRDTLTISTRVQHPILADFGNVVTTESEKRITNGKFCVDAYNALRFVAFVSGPGIEADPISGMLRPVNVNGFKWVVDRNPKMGKRPRFDERHLLRAGADENTGYSTFSGPVIYHADKPDSSPVDPRVIGNFVSLHRPTVSRADTASVRNAWEALCPKTLVVETTRYGDPYWVLLKPDLIADARLLETGDTLKIVPGALAGAKFRSASLDTPVCNFGRLPGPPPLTDSGWRDTLRVAIRDQLLIDAFYIYSPVHGRWGKALMKPEVKRDGRGVQIQFAPVIRPLADTSSFLFWRIEDPGFQDLRKCLTPVEAYRAMPDYRGQWEKN